MCSNQLINSSQVTLKGSSRCVGISVFLPLCSVMLAGEIRDYTEHLYHTTCHKYTVFPVNEQATIIGYSLLQEKLHFPLTTSLKMDLLKGFQSHRSWCKFLNEVAFCICMAVVISENYIQMLNKLFHLELKFKRRIKQDTALLDIKQCYSMSATGRILCFCKLHELKSVPQPICLQSCSLCPLLFASPAWSWWGKPAFAMGAAVYWISNVQMTFRSKWGNHRTLN